MRSVLRTHVLACCGMAAAVATVAPARAALVESTTPSTSVAFDSQLSTPALIYDANFYSATEGRMVLLATGASLRGPGVQGSNGILGTPPGQSYLNATDQLRDLVVSIRIDNRTGALISGTVNVPRDASEPSATLDSWSYSGYITAFGFAERNGTATTNTFDVRWFADAYDFTDVAANPSLGVPGSPASCSAGAGGCGYGYLRIGADAVPFYGGAGSGINFATDWVRGSGLSGPNAQLGAFDDNIAAGAFSANGVTADVFLTPVPVPGAALLLAGGLVGLLPFTRRRQAARA